MQEQSNKYNTNINVSSLDNNIQQLILHTVSKIYLKLVKYGV